VSLCLFETLTISTFFTQSLLNDCVCSFAHQDYSAVRASEDAAHSFPGRSEFANIQKFILVIFVVSFVMHNDTVVLVPVFEFEAELFGSVYESKFVRR
jgi:uncharacterized protein YqhQ